MSNIIQPTVGRKVYYNPWHEKPSADIENPDRNMAYYGDQPLDATVIYVWNNRVVNLSIIDHAGHQHVRTSVELVACDEVALQGQAEWMPYQKQKAEFNDPS